MEVMLLSPSVDFNHDRATSSPKRIASPSTPNRFTCIFSAPTSPTTTSSSFFHHFSTSPATTSCGSPSTIPSHWEMKPKIPKPKDQSIDEDEDDFQFDFTGQLQKTSLPAADELFDRGIIKTLKPPPSGLNNPIKSEPLPINTKSRRDSASPRSKKYDFERLAAAIEQSRNSLENRDKNKEGRERGREKTSNLVTSIRKQRGTRSMSPFGESCKKISNSSTSNNSKDSLSKKWKLRDLWLKKSNQEELKQKYSVLKKSSGGEDVKESSFRSTESGGGGGGSDRRRGAAERQYAATRAAAEEMRRKTVLPYKHGLLGCMGFSFDPVVHEISRGIGSLTRG